jgi:hypothetical protein
MNHERLVLLGLFDADGTLVGEPRVSILKRKRTLWDRLLRRHPDKWANTQAITFPPAKEVYVAGRIAVLLDDHGAGTDEGRPRWNRPHLRGRRW